MYKLAIVGATGLVGRTVLKILEEKDLPVYEYVLFSSKKSAGSVVHFKNKDYIVKELKENSFLNEHFDFAIFSAGRRNIKKICSNSY
jgi:aspartate-semialdehyde dehydrogenase